jgi:ribosomal protein S27E
MTAHSSSSSSEPGGPVHWLDGLRCPDCLTLNASWLCYDHTGGGPTVECEACGTIVRVLGPDDPGAAA